MRNQDIRSSMLEDTIDGCTTRPMSPIEAEIDNSKNLYNSVHSAISRLESKLQPALVVFPECAKKETCIAGGDPALLRSLRDINEAMEAMIKRLDDIAERCIL
jgi:hypothetical protein